jgi:hypothetical protein
MLIIFFSNQKLSIDIIIKKYNNSCIYNLNYLLNGGPVKYNIRQYEKTLNNWTEHFGTWFTNENNLKGAMMEADLYPYTALFEPITINSVTSKNRIVMAPMGNICMADETGRPSQKMISISRTPEAGWPYYSGLSHKSRYRSISDRGGGAFHVPQARQVKNNVPGMEKPC